MERTFVATFHGATRLINSANGNPRWKLHTSDGDHITEPDAALAVANHVEDCADSWIGKQVEFTARNRSVYRWKLAE